MNVFEANLKMKLDEIEQLKAENLELRELLGSFMTDLDLMDPDIRDTKLWKHYTQELNRINAKLKPQDVNTSKATEALQAYDEQSEWPSDEEIELAFKAYWEDNGFHGWHLPSTSADRIPVIREEFGIIWAECSQWLKKRMRGGDNG